MSERSSDEILYSEVTVGALIRHLNWKCYRKAQEASKLETEKKYVESDASYSEAEKLAQVSSEVEKALLEYLETNK